MHQKYRPFHNFYTVIVTQCGYFLVTIKLRIRSRKIRMAEEWANLNVAINSRSGVTINLLRKVI